MNPKKAELFIVALLTLVLGARGITAIVTRQFWEAPKFSKPYLLEGPQAIAAGASWLALGLAFLSFGIFRIWPQHKAYAWCWGSGCAIAYILGQYYSGFTA